MTTSKLVFKPLSPEMIEKGEIEKCKIAEMEEGDYEIGLLRLMPGAKIKKHLHDKNWEIYIIHKNNYSPNDIIDVCNLGESHELENTTNEVMEVIYIKGNNGVQIPKIF